MLATVVGVAAPRGNRAINLNQNKTLLTRIFTNPTVLFVLATVVGVAAP